MGIAEIRDYITPLLRWWWLIVLTALVATVSSYLYLQAQPSKYRTQATIMIGSGVQNLNPNNTQFGLAEQLAATYADIAGRAPLRHAVMEALGLNSLPPYVVKAVMSSPFIEITVTDEDPAVAQAVAQEIVTQLILKSPAGQAEQDRQQFIEEQLAQLELGIKETEDEISLKQNELAGLFSAREIATTQDQILALQNKLNSLRGNYSSMLANSQQNAVNRITVLEPAALPQRPIDQNHLLNLIIAALVGGTLGAAAAYLLEFMDTSIRDGHAIARVLGFPLLASIPAFKRKSSGLILNENPSGATEAYRALGLNLQQLGRSQADGVLTLIGPAAHDGKSVTAANLSITLAHSGKQVILVDGDLHRPRQHWLFQLPNMTGLSSLLQSDELEIELALQATSVDNLRVLPSGQLPALPSELLDSPRLPRLLDALRTQADYVILDTPPLSAVADAAILAAHSDGVLLVLRSEKTSWETAKRMVETLQQAGASILGIILNGVATQHSSFSDSTYGYGFQAAAATAQSGALRKMITLPGMRPSSPAHYALREESRNGHAANLVKDNDATP